MARSPGFKSVKHKFGEKVYMQPVYKIVMEGVGFDVSHEGLGVQEGRMLFTKSVIYPFQALCCQWFPERDYFATDEISKRYSMSTLKQSWRGSNSDFNG
jgi:hypothetical protein